MAIRLRGKEASWLALAVAAAAVPTISMAETVPGEQCKVGSSVITDTREITGTVIGQHDDLCLVKSKDGQIQRWIAATSIRVVPPSERAHNVPNSPETAARAPTSAPGIAVVRPATTNQLVYPADPLGHVVVTAMVNGTPVRFLVDTGATLVALTADDAKAVGIERSNLVYNRSVLTGNGPTQAAMTQLREVRIDQLTVGHVPAAVIGTLKQSVLGMSFLTRLKSFTLQNGAFTMTW